MHPDDPMRQDTALRPAKSSERSDETGKSERYDHKTDLAAIQEEREVIAPNKVLSYPLQVVKVGNSNKSLDYRTIKP